MKKRNMCIVCIIVILIAIASCENNGNLDKNRENTFLMLPIGEKVNLNVQYVQTEYYNEGEIISDVINIISSTKALEQYYEIHKNRVWDGYGNLLPDNTFLNAIKEYTENYFEENILVIVRLVENSGSNRHKVEKIDENGNIYIKSILNK